MKRLIALFALITSALALGQSYAPSGGDSLPDQTGNSGKFLTTDGSEASWAEISGLISGGVANRVTYYATATTITGSANLTFDGSTLALTGAMTSSGKISSSVAADGIALQVTQGAYIALDGVTNTSNIRAVAVSNEVHITGGGGIHLVVPTGALSIDTDSTIISNTLNSKLTIAGAGTDSPITYTAGGSSTTVGMNFIPKGTAGFRFGDTTAASFGIDLRTPKISTEGDITGTMGIYNGTTSYSSSPESGVFAGGFYTSGNAYATFGGITWTKENNTDGNVASYSEWATRPAGGNPTTYLRMTSTGLLAAYGTSPSFWLDARPNVAGAVGTDGSASAIMGLYNGYTDYNASPVSGIIFGTKYHSNGSLASGGAITVEKENATDNNVAYFMGLHVRAAGASPTKAVHITSTGNVRLEVTGARLIFNGSTASQYIYNNSGAITVVNGIGNFVVSPSLVAESNLNVNGAFTAAQAGGTYTFGNTGNDQYNWMTFVAGSTASATNTLNMLSYAGSGAANVSFNMVPKGSGSIKNNGDPIPAVHSEQTTSQVAIEFGNTAATGNALAVTFARAFASAPVCVCTIENNASSGCWISTAANTTSVTFTQDGDATDKINWQCIGAR